MKRSDAFFASSSSTLATSTSPTVKPFWLSFRRVRHSAVGVVAGFERRLLAERHLVDLLPSLLAGRTIEVLRTLRTELKEVTERIADDVVLARLDGVETIVHIELESRHNPELDHRIAVYHAMLLRKYAPRPVLSLVVYLMHRPPRAPISPGLPKASWVAGISRRYVLPAPLVVARSRAAGIDSRHAARSDLRLLRGEQRGIAGQLS